MKSPSLPVSNSPSSPPSSPDRSSWWYLGGFALLVTLFWLPVILFRYSVFAGDLRSHHAGLQLFHHTPVSGTLPLWNPLVFCGTPTAPIGSSGVFYPLAALTHALFPGLGAINAQIVLHFFLATIFMFGFMRSLHLSQTAAAAAAIIFAFCGDRVHHVMHLEALPASICLPLILWLIERVIASPTWSRLAMLPLGFGWLLLAGHPQITMFICYLTAAYTVFRFRMIHQTWSAKSFTIPAMLGTAMIGGGLLVGSAIMIPLLELLQHSERSGGGNLEFATLHSWPPLNLILFFIPHFFGELLKDVLGMGSEILAFWGQYYESWGYFNNYVGLLPLGLATVAAIKFRSPLKVFFGMAGMLTLILAMGKHTPVFGVFHALVPGFKFFRGPMHFLYLPSFCLAVLAGMGLHSIEQAVFPPTPPDISPQKKMKKKDSSPAPSALTSAVAILGIVAALSLVTVVGYLYHFSGLTLNAAWRGFPAVSINIWERERPYLFLFILIWLQLVAFAWYLRRSSSNPAQASRSGFALLSLTIISADFFLWFAAYNPVVDPENFRLPSAQAEYLKNHDRSLYRVFVRQTPTREDPWGNFNPLGTGMNVLHDIQKTDGFLPVHIKTYNPDYLNAMGKNQKLLDSANVKYFIVDGKIHPNPNVLPRAYLINRARIIPQESSRLEALQTLDPKVEVILEDWDLLKPVSQGTGIVPSGQVSLTRYEPDFLSLKTSSPTDAYLVLSDAYYPGWEALVDHRPQPIFRANHTFRAIILPKGDHEVTFRYRPPSVKFGKIVSLVSVGVLVVILGLGRKRPLRWIS